MTEWTLPDALRREVARDLRPVRPLPSPLRRTLAFAPVGLLVLFGLPLLWGYRQNLPAVSLGALWGASGVQALAGLAIVGLGLRESVPGRELSRRALAATVAGAGLLVLAVTLATDGAVPTHVNPAHAARDAWECFYMAVVPGAVAVVVAAVLAARALPGRPLVTGALCGLGAGLLVDAGVRLFCWISEPAHVLVSHGGAILGLTLLGVAAARQIEGILGRR